MRQATTQKEHFADDFEFCCQGKVCKVTEGKSHTFNGIETHEIITKIKFVCADCGKELREKYK